MQRKKSKSDFEIIREIGEGQFGKVYLVQDKSERQQYAMKKYNKDKIIRDSMVVRLFKNEVRILRTINHPNIIRCFHKFEDPTHYYLILNYCNQGDMEQLAKRGAVPEAKALMYLKQLCSGFQVLHEHKIMHRDFKPANVFLHDDTAVIGDFGFAKVGSELGQTALGTPLYSSPELQSATGDSVYDNLSDLWSLGMTLYKIVTGTEPWKVYSTVDLFNKAMTMTGQNLPFPQSPILSDKLKTLLKSMIEPDPKKRMTWHQLFNHELLREEIEAKSVVGCNPSSIEQTNVMFNKAKDRVSKDTIKLNKPEEFEDIFSSGFSSLPRSTEEIRRDASQGQKYLNKAADDFEEDWDVFDRELFSLDSGKPLSNSAR